jgi:hypothetical protein
LITGGYHHFEANGHMQLSRHPVTPFNEGSLTGNRTRISGDEMQRSTSKQLLGLIEFVELKI